MFAKTIIDSDAFLDMPLSTQSLYFHLSMRADDDGFVNNPKKISRMIGCGEDDLKLLIAKRFLLYFESGVVVIKHWLIHNTIRKDRKIPTNYQDEYQQLDKKDNGSYRKVNDTNGLDRLVVNPQPNDNQVTTKCPHSVLECSVIESSVIKNNTPSVSVTDLKNDFEKLWSLYPNKKSKPRAFTAYKRAIKDGVTNKEIQDGILAYKKEIEIKGTDKQFIKHGGTWFNNQGWEDEYNHEPPKKNYRKGSNYNEIIPEWVNKTDEPMQEEPTENKETIDEEELRRRLDELMGEDDDVQDNG